MRICTTASDFFQVAYPFNFGCKLVPDNSPFSSSRCTQSVKLLPPIYSFIHSPKWNPIDSGNRRNQCKNSTATENERAERDVECEVEVISWQERIIRAKVLVNTDVQSVWKALTDYEKLADFIPNLVSSRVIPCPHPGHIWLEQIGLQRALYWHIEARVVLDLQEFRISENHLEIRFTKVEGDFKKFEGKWSIKSSIRPSTATLSYEVNVIPAFNFPAIFLERIIKSQLPVNLLAVACRSEIDFEENQNGS